MYDKLYKEMHNARLTKDMETPVMMDLIGNMLTLAIHWLMDFLFLKD